MKVLWLGCLGLLVAAIVAPFGIYAWIKWYEPRTALPEEVGWTSIVGFGSQSGFREGCQFGAYRLSPETVAAFTDGSGLNSDWKKTPLRIEDGQYAFPDDGSERVTLFALHAPSCASDKLKRLRMSEAMHGALDTPGSRYRIHNQGEGLTVVNPATHTAWFAYYG